MHDSFLSQNLYESIVNLCNEHSIETILNLIITVHTKSHISEESVRSIFTGRNSALVNDRTNISVQRKEIEPLTAVIEQIDGEKFI